MVHFTSGKYRMTSEIAFSGIGAKPQGWDAYVAGYCRLFWGSYSYEQYQQDRIIISRNCLFCIWTCDVHFSFISMLHKILLYYYIKHIYIINKSYYRGVISLNICQRGLGATERGHRFMESTKQRKCSGIPMVQKKV